MLRLILRHPLNLLKVCLVFLAINFGVASAQISTPQPTQPRLIVDDISPTDLGWSDHAASLVFRDALLPGGEVEGEFNTWYQFDVNQEVLVQGNRWPLQVVLPTALESQVLPNGLMFMSPSGRYIVFPGPFSEPGIAQGSELKIYDTQQNNIITSGIPSGQGARTVGFFDIRWGNDNSFVVITIPESGGVPSSLNLYYVNLNGSEVSVHLLTSTTLNDSVLLVFDVFDVSSDGRSVLLKGGILGEFQSFVGIWDAQAPNDLFRIPVSQLDVSTVLDARFTSGNGTEFVFFDDQGVGRYDVSAERLEIINNQVTAQLYREAKFSPSGELLALADDTSVYWLDLRPAQPPL